MGYYQKPPTRPKTLSGMPINRTLCGGLMSRCGIANNRTMVFFLISFIALGQIAPAFAGQQASGTAPAAGEKKFELTIDNIMRGPALVGYEPSNVRWSADSQRLYFQWKQYNEPRTKDPDTYVVNRDGSGLRKLSEEDAKNAPPTNGDQSRDKKFTAFVDNGDIFIYDNATSQ